MMTLCEKRELYYNTQTLYTQSTFKVCNLHSQILKTGSIWIQSQTKAF